MPHFSAGPALPVCAVAWSEGSWLVGPTCGPSMQEERRPALGVSLHMSDTYDDKAGPSFPFLEVLK